MSVPAAELRQLRVFIALVEESTFTDAAIRLGVTQPAVSRLIAALETRIGVPLVETDDPLGHADRSRHPRPTARRFTHSRRWTT